MIRAFGAHGHKQTSASSRSLSLRKRKTAMLRSSVFRFWIKPLPMAVYGWFTEGFDTRDLKEAKALLDEL
jgi:hypothetical protein